ncbi:MAG: hypothetical protein LBO63_05990 [Oscillospiraceae bacterium]|nr:hypothetical protein [Oscillospiraceae bacterium]
MRGGKSADIYFKAGFEWCFRVFFFDSVGAAGIGCVRLCAGAALFVIAAKLRLAALLSACAAGGSFCLGSRGSRWAVLSSGGACCLTLCVQLCAVVAAFVIGAKLRLAAQLYACAAGGSFLVLARKEPKKPL